MSEEQKQLIFLIAAIVAIFGGIFTYLKWGKDVVKKIINYFRKRKPQIPHETIRVVNHERGCHWNLGKIDNEPAMQINGHLFVTNIIQDNVRILSIEIIKPRKARKKCVRDMVFTRHPHKDVYGDYPLLPNITTEISIDFWIQPPILKKEDKNLKLTVVLVDQFGNKHKVKNLLFKSRNSKKTIPNEPPAPPKESLYKIENDIEKQVASILKTEVERYGECGRRVGGLGSARLKGSDRAGLGSEWRRGDTPTNQSIDLEPKENYIISENAQALINLYKKLEGPDDQSVFINSLLNRLSRDTEYASVGYLIFLLLFRIGKLEIVFDISKEKLYKDSAHGFSDSLRLLDGLLRFEHASFSNELLDTIEQFIDGLDEHPFRIPERLSAIRVFRLNDKTK